MRRSGPLVMLVLLALLVAIWSAERQPAFVLAGPGETLRWATWLLLVGAAALATFAPGAPTARTWVVGACGALLLEEAMGPGAASSVVMVMAVGASGIVPGAIAAASVAALPRPGRRRVDAFVVGAVLAGAVAVVLVTDFRGRGCFACAPNPFAMTDRPTIADTISSATSVLALAAVLVTFGVVATRASGRRSDVGSLLYATAALVATVAAAGSHVVDGAGAVATGSQRLAVAAALAVMAACSWQPVIVERRARSVLLRVVRRAATASAGGIEQALRSVLRDPRLTLCYVMDDGNLIDALGNVVEQGSPPPGGVTVIDFDGQEIARLDHSTAVQVERRPLEDIAAIAGPALAQEREAAVLAARLTKLAAARRAVIERGDVERRALERELHDHTQQRLVSIMIELRMAAERDPEPFDVENALVDVGSALEQVRTIAHGVFPTGLAEEGLAAVLEELALRTHGRIEVDASRGRPTDPVAEATAYMVVAECVGRLPDRDASVQVVVAPQRVDIRVMGEGANDAALAGVRARTLALGGSWRRADDDVLQVVVPCAS